MQHDLHWLWTMVNERVAFYRIDPNRTKKAFEQLIQDWNGVLISDSYGCYIKWIGCGSFRTTYENSCRHDATHFSSGSFT
jgi:hypothetical protein